MLFCPRFWLPGGEAQVGEKGALRGDPHQDPACADAPEQHRLVPVRLNRRAKTLASLSLEGLSGS